MPHYNETVAALPDDLRSFVVRIAEEKHVSYNSVIGAVFDGCTRHQIEALSPERFVYFVRGVRR